MTVRGLEADVAALIRAEADQADGGGQLGLDLFDDMPSPVAELAEARGVELRRRGRPQGSKSRQNLDVVKLIKATKRPTLLVLKEWVDLPLDEFARLIGTADLVAAFDRWSRLAELVTAYEEGRPTQRVDMTSDGERIPVVVFGSEPVRADLVNGNPPIEAEYSIVDQSASTNDMTGDDVSRSKSHGDDEPEVL